MGERVREGEIKRALNYRKYVWVYHRMHVRGKWRFEASFARFHARVKWKQMLFATVCMWNVYVCLCVCVSASRAMALCSLWLNRRRIEKMAWQTIFASNFSHSHIESDCMEFEFICSTFHVTRRQKFVVVVVKSSHICWQFFCCCCCSVPIMLLLLFFFQAFC